jgi:hypothetical protein
MNNRSTLRILVVLMLFSTTSNMVQLSEIIEQKCVAYGEYLTKVSTSFMECAFNNSRPLNICKNCAQLYLEFIDVYDLMTKVSGQLIDGYRVGSHFLCSKDTTAYATTLYTNGLICRDILEARDRVQFGLNIFDIIFNTWEDLKCPSNLQPFEDPPQSRQKPIDFFVY